MCSATKKVGDGCEGGGGEPDPDDFGLQDGEAAVGEETRYSDGRDVDRRPRQEVAAIVEWGEEGYAQTTVGHSIEQAVARCDQEEIEIKGKSGELEHAARRDEQRNCGGDQRGKEERVREAAVAPEVGIRDAEAEADYIEVGDDRAESAYDEDTFGRARFIKAGADSEGSNGVGYGGGHCRELTSGGRNTQLCPVVPGLGPMVPELLRGENLWDMPRV
jgi:hypothetical protein